MKAIEELEKRLRNEMVTRIDDGDIVDILEVLQDAGEEINRLTQLLEQNQIPVNPCNDCGKEERNLGLDVCGSCYHKRITGKH